MTTRSVVAFRDGESITGVYLDFDGAALHQVPLLRAVFHGTFFRDLHQMRTVLLKHTAGWALLNPDPAQTAAHAGDDAYLEVPGIGIAYTADIDASRTGEDVFDRDHTFLFDMADSSLRVFYGREPLLTMPLDDWARIGPWHTGDTLPIVAADPIGERLLTGAVPAYTEAHISALLGRLGWEPGEPLLGDGAGLFEIHYAAVKTGLLPKATWFITDAGNGDSEVGRIVLPHPVSNINICIDFHAADHLRDRSDTGQAVRRVLEAMASAIAAAAEGLAAWRAPEPTFVLNVHETGTENLSVVHGPAARVHTMDFRSLPDYRPADAQHALEWVATQVAGLHEFPLELRREAYLHIEYVVQHRYPAARTMAAVLTEDTVDPVAARRARLAAGRASAEDEADGREDFQAWLGEHTGYEAACRWAATDQGLDPISAALHAAGIEHHIDQTGGFCMVLRVQTLAGFHLGITASEEPNEVLGRHWLVMRYSDTEFDDGEIISTAMPTPDVIALANGYLHNSAEDTDHDAMVKAVDTATEWIREELDAYEGAVDDLLNLVVNATSYAADHPDDGTLADAIEANYDGSGCLRDCDDGDDCDDPEHSNVVEEVLSWIAPLA